LGERAPAAADRIENRAPQRSNEAVAQDLVNPALGCRMPAGEHRLDRQRAERQADPVFTDTVVDRLRHLETAAAHVADSSDRAKKSRDDAQGPIMRLFGTRQDAN